MVGLRALAAALTLHLAVIAGAPACWMSFVNDKGRDQPACCKTGRDATCPMHEGLSPAAAAARHASTRLCRCSPADLGVVFTGILSPVVPRFALSPELVALISPLVSDRKRLDVPRVPPGPPPKSISLL